MLRKLKHLAFGLFAASLVAPFARAITVEDVRVVDVTPTQFSVIWLASESATPNITIYDDAAGTTDITSQFELTLFPVQGGNPELETEQEQDAAEAAIQAQAEQLGQLKVTVSGGEPGTTYYFQLHSIGDSETILTPAAAPFSPVTTMTETAFVEEGYLLLLTLIEPARTSDATGLLFSAFSSETLNPVSTYGADGVSTDQAVLNLSNLYVDDGSGTSWVPEGQHDVIVNMNGFTQVYTLTFPDDFGTNATAAREFRADPALTLNVVEVDEGATATASVEIPEALGTNLDVTLVSEDTDELTVPNMVTIIAGQLSVNFDLTGVDDSVEDPDAFVLLTASATGYDNGVAQVTVRNIHDDNVPPVANNDSDSTNEDTNVTIPVSSNDSDADGTLDLTEITIVAAPTKGSIMDNDDGTLTYQPNLNEFGQDSFTYTIKDNEGATSNEATVTVDINDVNDDPVADNDSATTNEDVDVTIDVVDGDMDVDGTLVLNSIVITDAPDHGMLTDNLDGTLLYDPDDNYNGSDSFTYTIKDDDDAVSNEATVTITINDVNDPPVAGDDSFSTDEDTATTFNITTNDTDVDGTIDLGTIEITQNPGSGMLEPLGSGTFRYTPNGGFAGPDTVKYTIKDNDDDVSNEATVTITVNAVNQPPMTVADNATTPLDTPVTIELLDNDTDDGSLTVESVMIVDQPSDGSVVNNGDGSVRYTPNEGFTGTDQFTYTVEDNEGAVSNVTNVTVEVNPPNEPPVADDDSGTTSEDVGVVIDVADGDTDADGTIDLTSVMLVNGPAHGAVQIHNNGTVTYTPELNFNGTDLFSYTIADDEGDRSNQAQVVITINPVNDAPIANNDDYAMDVDGMLTIGPPGVLGNDFEPEGQTMTAAEGGGGSGGGTFTLDGNGGFTYEPPEGFEGVITRTYTVSDGDLTSSEATIRIEVTSDPILNVFPGFVAELDSGTNAMMNFRFVLPQPHEVDVTVDYSTADGSADSASDYTAASGTVSIAAGQTSTSLNILVTGDDLHESNEEFVLLLSNPMNVAISDPSVEGNILNDDDAPVVDFSLTQSNGLEANGSVNLQVTLDAISGLDTLVAYGPTGGSADSPDDYSLPAGEALIPAGALTTNISLSIVNDEVFEGPEDVVVMLLEPVTNAELGPNDTHTYTIDNDDDMPTVEFGSATSTTNEDVGTLFVNLNLSTESGAPVTVNYTVVDGSAISADHGLRDDEITIPAGNTAFAISVPIVDDELDEPDESFRINLASATGAQIGDQVQTVVTILDDDEPPMVSFVEPTGSALENVTPVTMAVELSAASSLDVVVDYTIGDPLPPRNGSDYSQGSGTLTIPAGQTSGDIVVDIVGDELDEDDETFRVTLDQATNATIDGGIRVQTILDDDDLPVVEFQLPASDASEDANLSIEVTLDVLSGRDVMVDYQIVGGSATQGTDHQLLTSGTVTIPAGSISAPITAVVEDDMLFEGNEDILLELLDPVNADLGAQDAHTYQITENDAVPVVEFVNTNESTTEADGTLALEVSVTPVSGLPVTVSYSVFDGTATSADHDLVNGQLTIPAGMTTGNIDVSIVDDASDEPDESFRVVLHTPVDADLGTQSTDVTIEDNDEPPTVSFVENIGSASENVTSLPIPVQLSEVSGFEILVDYTVGSIPFDRTSTDYLETSGTLTIPAGMSGGNILVQVFDDQLDEPAESFPISLTGATNASVSGNLVRIQTIIDNDEEPTVEFELGASAAQESEDVDITVKLDVPSGRDIIVDYRIVGGSATSGTDYQIPSSGTVTIPEGSISARLTGTIEDDFITEGNEDIIFEIHDADFADVGAVEEHIYTIIDNEVSCPDNIIVDTVNSNGLIVHYDLPPELSGLEPICQPASGSVFPIGVTTVDCLINEGRDVVCSFDVTVNLVDPTDPYSGLAATGIANGATVRSDAMLEATANTSFGMAIVSGDHGEALRSGTPIEYDFFMGEGPITVGQFLEFLNTEFAKIESGAEDADDNLIFRDNGNLVYMDGEVEILLFKFGENNNVSEDVTLNGEVVQQELFDYGIRTNVSGTGDRYQLQNEKITVKLVSGLPVKENTGSTDFDEGLHCSRYTEVRNFPILGVTWYGAVYFCNWASLRKGLPIDDLAYHIGPTPSEWHPANLTTAQWLAGAFDEFKQFEWAQAYPFAYRLPTENEFYWAASSFSVGDFGTINGGNYWSSGDFFDNGPTPIGYYEPLEQGRPLYDLSGNVWEWQTNFFGSNDRAIRGGSWYNDQEYSKIVHRFGANPILGYADVGFRVVAGYDYVFNYEYEVGGGEPVSSGWTPDRSFEPTLMPAENYQWRVTVEHQGFPTPTQPQQTEYLVFSTTAQVQAMMTVNSTNPEDAEHNLPLNSGWNIVSFNIEPENCHSKHVFPMTATIWAWNAELQCYQHAAGNSIRPYTGYWVNIPAGQLSQVATQIYGFSVLEECVTIFRLWNLIGPSRNGTKPDGDGVNPTLISYQLGYRNVDEMSVGSGFWMFATKSGVLKLGEANKGTFVPDGD